MDNKGNESREEDWGDKTYRSDDVGETWYEKEEPYNPNLDKANPIAAMTNDQSDVEMTHLRKNENCCLLRSEGMVLTKFHIAISVKGQNERQQTYAP